MHITRQHLLIAASGLLLLPVPLLALTFVDAEYRSCMSQAHYLYQTSVRAIEIQHHQTWDAAKLQQIGAYQAAWGLQDDRSIRQAMRDADRSYKDSLRSARDTARDTQRQVQDTFRQKQRTCRDQLRDRTNIMRNDPTYGERCSGNNQCNSGLVCTTVYGECRPFCEPNSDICHQCGGRCALPR